MAMNATASTTPTPATPPAFPWRRFLSRLAWWAVAVMAGAFVAAEVWP